MKAGRRSRSPLATITAIDFALPRGGVIFGRITDEGGEAMPRVRVQVQRFQYAADGERRLATVGTDTTDDRRYLATAIEAMEQNRQYSPEFRRQLQRGAREFTLNEGETLSLDLRLTTGL